MPLRAYIETILFLFCFRSQILGKCINVSFRNQIIKSKTRGNRREPTDETSRSFSAFILFFGSLHCTSFPCRLPLAASILLPFWRSRAHGLADRTNDDQSFRCYCFALVRRFVLSIRREKKIIAIIM